MALTVTQGSVNNILLAMFNAAPGKTFLDQFTAEVEASIATGSTLPEALKLMTDSVANSPLFSSLYPAPATGEADSAFAAAWVTNFLGTTVTPEILAVAIQFVNNTYTDGMSRADLVTIATTKMLSYPTDDVNFGEAAAIIGNKMAASSNFSETQDSGDFATLLAAVSSVTKDASSVPAVVPAETVASTLAAAQAATDLTAATTAISAIATTQATADATDVDALAIVAATAVTTAGTDATAQTAAELAVVTAQTALDAAPTDPALVTALATAKADAATLTATAVLSAAASVVAATAVTNATAADTAAAAAPAAATAAAATATDSAAAFVTAAALTTATEDDAAAVLAVSAAAAANNNIGGGTFTLTNNAIADTIIGTAKNDTITGASGTVVGADLIIDQSTTDNDTANLVVTAAYTPANITNIENVNVDWNAFGTATVNATGITGANNITLTSSKVGFLGAAAVVAGASQNITAGTGMSGLLTVTGATTALTVNGGTATGISATGTGIATITAGTATTAVTSAGFTTATVDAGTATVIAVSDAAGTGSTTALTVGANNTLTNTGTGALTITADTASLTTTISAVGASLDMAGTADTTLSAAYAALTAETVTKSTAGVLTVALTGAIGTDMDVSSVAADNFTIATAFGSDNALAIATGATINLSVDAGNGEFGVLAANDSAADTLTINSTAAVQTIIQSDGNGGTVGDIETLTIAAAATAVTGTDLTIGAIEAGVNTVNVTGTNDVVITTLVAGTVNASGLTGNLTATQTGAAATSILGATATNVVVFNSTAADSSYTGQAGSDTVTFIGTTGNSTAIMGDGANSVTSGAGTTGSLVVVGGTGVDTVTATVAGTGTGEANLNLGDGNDAATLTFTGAADILTVDMGAGTDALTLVSPTSAGDVLTIDMGLGVDTLNISTDVSLGTWTVAGLETIAIGSANAAAIVDASLVTGQTYNVTGDGTVTDLLSITTATAGAYDFSGLVINQTLTLGLGGVTVVGNAGNDTIIGTNFADTLASGNGTDTLTGGLGVDTYTGGTGVDTFVIASADTGITGATADKIDDTSFATTTDKLSLGVAGSAANYTELVAVDNDTLAQTLVDVNAAMDGTVKYVLVGGLDTNAATGGADGADGALFIDADMNGTVDDMIVISGASDNSTFAFADIIA